MARSDLETDSFRSAFDPNRGNQVNNFPNWTKKIRINLTVSQDSDSFLAIRLYLLNDCRQVKQMQMQQHNVLLIKLNRK